MNLNVFLDHKTKTVSQAGIILAFSALFSRILGLIRDWLLAKNFGASADLDVYFTAFKIPDLVYNILILGGVVVAFLPLFSEYFSKNKEEAWEFSSNCLNVFLFLLILLCVFFFILSPFLVKIAAPGFNSGQLEKTIFLSRIMFLSPIFFGLSSIFSGILQYFNRFLIYALCPLFYNIGIIFGILVLVPRFGILGVAFGVVTGAFLHFAVQIPSVLSCGFSYKPILKFNDPKIKKIFLLMIPRTFGVSANQINLIVINAIASTLSEGSISIFNFANNIQFFPIGIIGASFATAAFPLLSKNWAAKEKNEFLENFSSVFRKIVYLILPLSLLFFILRDHIIYLLLRHGQFSVSSARLASASLGLFCFGIFSSSLLPLFFRAFFSLKDTKTPTFIALFSIILNIALSFFLTKALISPSSCMQSVFRTVLISTFSLQGIKDISVLGLSFAASISSIFQLIVSFLWLWKKIGDFKIKSILNSFVRILAGLVLMLLVIYLVFPETENLFNKDTLFGRFYYIILISLIGFSAYFFSTYLLGSFEAENLKNLFFNKINFYVKR